jgi:hypothetical protein
MVCWHLNLPWLVLMNGPVGRQAFGKAVPGNTFTTHFFTLTNNIKTEIIAWQKLSQM